MKELKSKKTGKINIISEETFMKIPADILRRYIVTDVMDISSPKRLVTPPKLIIPREEIKKTKIKKNEG